MYETQSQTPNANTFVDVLASTLRYVLAGIAAGFVVFTSLLAFGASIWDALAWAAGAAAIVAGWLTFWMFGITPFALIAKNELLKIECDRLEDANAILVRERDEWRKEAETQSLLRNKSSAYVPPVSVLDPVRQTASVLVDYWLSTGQHPSRRKMEETGITQTQYAAALDFLRANRGVELNGSQVTWKIHTRAQADVVLG